MSAAAQDLYPWVPEERYDVIVASLYQMPVDPFEQVTTHRPLDYWGRNLLDHLIRLLPEALADDGTRVHHAAVDHRRAAHRAAARPRLGYQARVVDFGFFEFHDLFNDKAEQITRVEELSDAYHLKLGDHRRDGRLPARGHPQRRKEARPNEPITSSCSRRSR